MGFKIKRRSQPDRGSKRRKTAAARPMLVSFGEGDNCDCPICQAFGIDLDESGGLDLRPLSAEDLEILDALTRQIRGEPGGLGEA